MIYMLSRPSSWSTDPTGGHREKSLVYSHHYSWTAACKIIITITPKLLKMAHYQSTLALHSALLPWDRQEATHKHHFVMGMQVAAAALHNWFHVKHLTGTSDPLLMVFYFQGIIGDLKSFKLRVYTLWPQHDPHRRFRTLHLRATCASPAPPVWEADTRSRVRWRRVAHGSDGEEWMWGAGRSNSVADIINRKGPR